jgi:hypothetical protein
MPRSGHRTFNYFSLRSSVDMRGFMQNDIQQYGVDFDVAIVIDQAQFSELVHKKIHAGARRANHLSERLLADLRNDRLGPALLAKIRQQ